MRSTALLLSTLLLASLTTEASAQDVYVGVGLGPAVGIRAFPTQFRIEEEIGLTFGGEDHDGFFLSFAPAQSFDANSWALIFPLRFGATTSIFRTDDLTFQIGGMGELGFALARSGSYGPDAGFHLGAGALLRVLLMENRLAIFLRPVGFEFTIGENGYNGGWATRWVAALGVQYYL